MVISLRIVIIGIKVIMEEKWKTVKGYSNYQISNQGRLYNSKLKRFFTGSIMNGGYIRIKMTCDGKTKNFLLHRIVAEHFIPNPESKPEVNHLGEKNDNRASMLEWTTRKENMAHSAKFKTKCFLISVHRLDSKSGEILQTYSSITEAAKNGYTTQGISMCINGKMTHHKGFKWSRVDPLEKLIENEGEIWKELKNSIYEEVNQFKKYKVSNYGQVKGWYNNILKTNTCNGYASINLIAENRHLKSVKIHRLVLMAFNVPNPKNKKEVDHIDSDITNNKLDNLRWADRKDQNSNPKSCQKLQKRNEKRSIKIEVIFKNQTRIVNGLNYLAKEIKISPATITKYAKLNKEYKGYLFKILDEKFSE